MKPCDLLYYVYVITEQTNLMKKNNDNDGTYYVNAENNTTALINKSK